jgi:hypothetical protein
MARGLIAAALAALLTGCAGGMTKADCQSADWSALGFADGRSGASAKLAEKRLNDCAGGGHAVDRAAYAAGRSAGLKAYCTAAGGFDAGRLGQEYLDVCSAPDEEEFLAAFEEGAKLHALIRAENEANRALKAAVDGIDQNSFLLKSVERRAASSTISYEGRETARQEAASLRRELARLEQNLPKLEAAIATARAEREAYETSLRASGRIF